MATFSYYYGINDYGELTVIKTKSKLKPWDKLILQPLRHNSRTAARVCSPKRKQRVECELLRMNYVQDDPAWSWEFA